MEDASFMNRIVKIQFPDIQISIKKFLICSSLNDAFFSRQSLIVLPERGNFLARFSIANSNSSFDMFLSTFNILLILNIAVCSPTI